MIRETVTSFDPGWGELIDLDVLDSGDWAGVFRDGSNLFVRTAKNKSVAPDGIRFPIIRCLEPGRIALIDTRTQEDRTNAWILCPQRNEIVEFFAGDGIQDVLANSDTIVVTYFDEGVFGRIRPGDEGVAVFDSRGHLRAGYRSTLGSRAVDIADCYAACWESDWRIAFLPYTEFPLVRLDVRTFDQNVVQTPRRLHGSSAISVSRGDALFFGPYDEKRSILAWHSGGEISSVGAHSGPLRGLRGGRFLTHGTSGFTIVECGAAQQGVTATGASPGS